MRVPLSWLREFAPVAGPVEELAHALSDLGLVVEGVELVGQRLDGVITARVIATRPHPNAEKLQLVDVDIGNGQSLQVVCGVFNFGAGDIVPLATVGAVLPNGMEMGRRKVRGEWSNGMLCAPDELGLGDDHSGIFVLPADVELGVEVNEALGVQPDVVFDLDVSPNRPDAMSVAGVARDLAARLRVPFAIPEPRGLARGPASSPASLRVDSTDLCPRFTTQVLTGIVVGPSPSWMATRLTLAGMRPINNLVDISNYVMLELGQPNHAYDLERLGDRGLLVRRGRAGEVVVTLDDVAREVGEDDCLICDATDVPVGIGGVMGGASSEISEDTTTVYLETAYFTPMAIARPSKRLGLRTEASARFERGTDPEGIERSVARFCELAADIAGASLAGDLLIEGVELPPRAKVSLRTARVNAVLGTSLTDSDVSGYLRPIGFDCIPKAKGVQEVTIPSWRPDSDREIDLIEEIARHHGYSRMERTMPASTARVGSLSPYQRDRRRVRDILVGAGLDEAWTTSLLGPGDIERAGLDPSSAVRLSNPLASEESVLRTSLLPGLLRALSYNAAHRHSDVSLFEVGHVFGAPTARSDLPAEAEHLAVALGGRDAVAAKQVWDLLVDALGVTAWALRSGEVAGLHPTRTAPIVHVPTGGAFGAVGEVDPEVLAAWEVPGRVGWFHVSLEWLLGLPRRPSLYRAVSRFPSSDIDLAFVVEDAVPADQVEATLAEAGGEVLVSLRLFDVFRGPQLGEGRRSLAYRLRFNSLDHTLTDQEVAELRRRCIEAVERAHGAQLRS